MKKSHFSILICILLCALLAFALVGCNRNALSRPQGVKFDPITMTLSWKDIDDASYYIVNVSGNGVSQDKKTQKNSQSIDAFKLGAGDYQLKVKACGDGKEYKNSAWSKTISFSQDAETGLTYRFINNNTEVEVSGMGRATGVVTIPDTYRGVPVTRIGDRAFANKSALKGVVFGKNVKTIGSGAFNGSYLESITFTDSITMIGDNAFRNCKLLTGIVELPEKLQTIGEYAFSFNTGITGVKFNDELETIGANAFLSCSEITDLDLPDSLEYIDSSAFSNCKKLVNVKFGNGLIQIGEMAFALCDSIETVRLNDGLQVVGNYAFGKCPKLHTVAMPDSVIVIGDGAFLDDVLLINVNLSKKLQRIGSSAFLNTAIWNESESKSVHLDNWFLGYRLEPKEEGDTTVEKIDLKINEGTIGLANMSVSGFKSFVSAGIKLPNSVKIIGDGAFANSSITSIIIGSGVEEIGIQAFAGCTLLRNVILGSNDTLVTNKLADSSLKIINEYAFKGCTRLENIEIPDSIEVINSYAFNDSAIYNNASDGVVYAGNWVVGCNNSKVSGKITIKMGTVGIANYSFYKCDRVTEVTISDTVEKIGRSAFYQCTELTTVHFPSKLENINDYTFYGCSKLKIPTLPNTLKTIGRSAFYKCALANPSGQDTEEDTLIIPESVETIGEYAFFGCGYTESDPLGIMVIKRGIDIVIIGDGVKRIGANAFNTISTLKSVKLGTGLREIGEKAFYQCESLANIEFNQGLQKIGARAFYGCSKLTEIMLPNALFEIGNYAFYKCTGLERIRFGEFVESIGDFAFYGCSSLTSLNLPDSVVSIGRQAFRSCSSLESVILKNSITSIAAHAFYGCNKLTIYAQGSAPQSGWNERFNSGYRPVVWNCTFEKDSSYEINYVYSVTKTANTVSNPNSINTLTAPQRDGYKFVGWATSASATEAEYSAENLATVPDGTTLYAVWEKDTTI